MPAAIPYVLGNGQRVWLALDTTFGTQPYPSAQTTTNREIRVRKSMIGTAMGRNLRNDSRTTRSKLERITAKTANKWELECYLMGSGTAGTPPNVHALLLAALGGTTNYTNTPATSDLYACGDTQGARPSVTLYRWFGDTGLGTGVFMDTAVSALVTEMKLSAKGGEEPIITFSGAFKKHLHTGYSTVASNTGTTLTVQTADANNFEVGSIIEVGGDDSTGDLGYRVTANASGVLTCVIVSGGGAPSFGALTGQAIRPHLAAGSTVGSPISGNLGSLSLLPIGGSAYVGGALPITAVELNLNNNDKAIDDQMFEAEISDAIPGPREVTGSISLRCRRDILPMLGNRKQFTQHDLTLTLGSAAGARCVVTLDCELDFSDMDVPGVSDTDASEAVIQVPLTGIADSAASELELLFN